MGEIAWLCGTALPWKADGPLEKPPEEWAGALEKPPDACPPPEIPLPLL